MSLLALRERDSKTYLHSDHDNVQARTRSVDSCMNGVRESLSCQSSRSHYYSGGGTNNKGIHVKSHGLRLTKSRSESSLGSALVNDSYVDGVDQQRFNLAISRLPQPKLKLRRRRSFVVAADASVDVARECDDTGSGTRDDVNTYNTSVSLDNQQLPNINDCRSSSNHPTAGKLAARHGEGYHCMRQESEPSSAELQGSGRQHNGGSHAAAVMSLSCISERSECSSIGSFQIAGAVSSVVMPGVPMDHSLMFSSTISTMTDVTGAPELLNNVEPPSMMHSVISLHDRSPTLSRKDLPLLPESRDRFGERSYNNPATGGDRKKSDRSVAMQNSLLLLDSMTDSVFDLERVKPPATMDEIDMENSLFNLDSLRSEADIDSAATLTQNTADRTLQPSSFLSQDTDQTIELASETIDSDTDLCTTEDLPVDEPNHSKASDSMIPFVTRNVWLKSCTSTDPLSIRDSSSECLSHESTDYSDGLTITISNPDTTATETLCHSCSCRVSKTFPQSGHGLMADIRSDSGSMLNTTCDKIDNDPSNAKKCFISAKPNWNDNKIASMLNVTKLQSINDGLCDVFNAKIKSESGKLLSERETTYTSQATVGNLKDPISEKSQRNPIKLARTRSDRSCFPTDKTRDEPTDNPSSKKLIYSAPWRSNMRREVRHVSPARRVTNTPRRNERPQSAMGDRDSSCSRITVRETKTTQLRRATTTLLGTTSVGLSTRDRSADARVKSPALGEALSIASSSAKVTAVSNTSTSHCGGDGIINKRRPFRRTQPPRPVSTDLSLLNRTSSSSGQKTSIKHNSPASLSPFGVNLRSSGPSLLPHAPTKRHIVPKSGPELDGDDDARGVHAEENEPPSVLRQRTFTLDENESSLVSPPSRPEPTIRRPSLPPRPRTSPVSSGTTRRSDSHWQHPSPRHLHLHIAQQQPQQPVIPKSISCDSGLRTTSIGSSVKSLSGSRQSRRIGMRTSFSNNSALQPSVRSTSTVGGSSNSGSGRSVNVMAVIQPYNYRPPERQNSPIGKNIDGARRTLKRRGDLV